MAHIRELEELEGKVNKHLQQCELCTLRDQREAEDWCYIFVEAPTKKCDRITYKRSILESNELNRLFNTFPNLNQDN